MAYIVKAFTPGKLNLAPETLEEEVLQNVAIIVSTPKFSVPLDRGLGLAQRFIDKPMQVAQSILISISIHALREEGDGKAAGKPAALQAISIHALREEGDPLTRRRVREKGERHGRNAEGSERAVEQRGLHGLLPDRDAAGGAETHGTAPGAAGDGRSVRRCECGEGREGRTCQYGGVRNEPLHDRDPGEEPGIQHEV